MHEKNKYVRPTLSFIFLSSIFYLANVVVRENSFDLAVTFFAAFFIYAWIAKLESKSLNFIFWLGLSARLLAFFSLPNLSDDFYRFIWDGTLLHQAIDPYKYLPQDLEQLSSMQKTLLPALNSPGYYSVYPPSNQLIFFLATSFEGSVFLSVTMIRLVLLVGELGTFWLLKRLYVSIEKISWIWLNPLILIEGVGNLHFEVMVITFLIAGFLFLKKNYVLLSGVAFGVAASIKLLPVIYLPYMFSRYFWKKGLIIASAASIALVVSFLPFMNSMINAGISESLLLYFRKFEFNASIYYLIREIDFYRYGYNTIGTLGPRLAIFNTLVIVGYSIFAGLKKRPAAETLMFLLTFYLLLSTTVHPWYILPLIVFGVLSGYYYPILWSFLIITTYFGYTEDSYQLSTIWLIIEYILVIGFMITEIWRKYAIHKTRNNNVSYGGF